MKRILAIEIEDNSGGLFQFNVCEIKLVRGFDLVNSLKITLNIYGGAPNTDALMVDPSNPFNAHEWTLEDSVNHILRLDGRCD